MQFKQILHQLITAGLFLSLLVPLFVFNSLFFPYITSKVFVFRIIVEVLGILWLWLILLDKSFRPRRTLFLYGIVIWVAVIALATLFGVDPYRSFWSNYERMEGLVNFLHLGLYFLMLGSVLRSQAVWKWFLHFSLGASVIAVLLALGEYVRASGESLRLAATFGNPIYLAVYLLLQIFLTLLLFIQTNHRGARVTYGIVMIGQLFVLYQTGTRSALLGLLVGLFVALAVVAIRGRELGRTRVAAAALLVAALIAGGGFWLARDSASIQNSPVLSRIANISLADATTRHRLINWQMALQGFKERPLLGWGPENYLVVFSKYFDPALYDAEPWFDRTHNIFLDWLVSAGLLGLLSYLSLFVIAIYLVSKKHEFSLLEKAVLIGLFSAYLFNNIFVFDNLTSYLIFFLVLAYIQFRTTKETEVKKRELKGKSFVFQLGAGALILVAGGLVIFFIGVKPILANSDLLQALASNQAERKLELFQQAFGHQTLADVEIGEQLISTTIGVIQSENVSTITKQNYHQLVSTELPRLIELFPTNARLSLFYGTYLRALGDNDSASVYLNQALALAPTKQAILFELIRLELARDNPAKAFEYAKRAYELAPANEDARRFYDAFRIEIN